jgi:sugar phosphate isomerase/epimerase
MVSAHLSVATRSVAKDLKQSLGLITPWGVEGVQFDYMQEIKPFNFSESGKKQLFHLLKECELKLASVTVPLRKSLSDEVHIEARLDVLKEAMQFAASGRAQVITFRAGRIPASLDSKEGQLLIAILSEIGQLGEHLGVIPCIIPSHDDPAKLLELLEKIPSGSLMIDFDPAICIMSELDPIKVWSQWQSRAFHVEARDAVINFDGGGLEVMLGEGDVDWRIMIAVMNESLPHIWVNHSRNQGEDKQREVLVAIKRWRDCASKMF